VPLLSPDPHWGCFPDTNGIAMAVGSDGKRYLFTANGGTDDVSVIDLEAALSGNKTPEIMRIPTQAGPFGIAASPDGRWVVSANRESQKVAFEGNTISIIDVNRARVGDPGAEVARVRVGTSDPNVQTRPFLPSFTPDGREIRGGLGNQDTAISGNSAPTDRARCPGKQKDHEQKTAPKSLVDLQGQGGLGRHSRREDVGRIGQGA
jgi:DNA-binding beta-propeller fold protein YncE